MKRRIYNIISGAFALLSVSALMTSCDEFDPVFTGKYPSPETYEPVVMTANTTIRDLAEKYSPGTPWKIDEDIIIAGKVSTSDASGNFYRTLYIQDDTGGIELKLGKTGLYNDYKPGQTVYVDCKGLWLGMYGYDSDPEYGGNGMVQLGYEDPSEEYETSYIEVQYLIDQHIFRGEFGDPVEPVTISESQLPDKTDTQATNEFVGRLVTLENLKYGDQIFALLYINPNVNGKVSGNRVFLSNNTPGHNVTTWAMSEQKVVEHLLAGDWDDFKVGNSGDYNYGSVADHKEEMLKYARPANVSQYFKMGSTDVQIRTSGYSRFADLEIDPEVLSGAKTINATGILTMYEGKVQFVLIDQNGIKINE